MYQQYTESHIHDRTYEVDGIYWASFKVLRKGRDHISETRVSNPEFFFEISVIWAVT